MVCEWTSVAASSSSAGAGCRPYQSRPPGRCTVTRIPLLAQSVARAAMVVQSKGLPAVKGSIWTQLTVEQHPFSNRAVAQSSGRATDSMPSLPMYVLPSAVVSMQDGFLQARQHAGTPCPCVSSHPRLGTCRAPSAAQPPRWAPGADTKGTRGHRSLPELHNQQQGDGHLYLCRLVR